MADQRRRGDRFDAARIRDVDSMHAFMPYMFPNRTDNEAFISESIELTALNEYLARKNEGRTEHRYTYFYAMLTALARTITLRPKMNRFFKARRYFQRNHLTMAFVVKKQFHDDGGEALAFVDFHPEDTLDIVHDRIVSEILTCRSDKPDNSTAVMDVLTKLPRFALRFVMGILNFLDYHGIVPHDIIKTDPYHASVFLTNLGSIGLKAGYHHLGNWGTGSIFVVLGEKRWAPVYGPTGIERMREVMDVGITLDERIADGYYYAGTVKLLKHLLSNPELLDQPMREPVSL